MRIRTISLLFALLASRVVYAQVDVLTAQYNLNRTSSNMQETTLTRANVNTAQFGKLFTRLLDAPFYASPLIVTNFNVPGVGVRDLVFVATLGDTVYAFDADDPTADAPYWSVKLGTPMQTACCYSSNIVGSTLGILSTPFIDRSTNTIYVTAVIQASDVGLYVFALDLSTGALKFNSPRRITYLFPSGATKTDASPWFQRAALLVYNNVLYIGTADVTQIDGDVASQEGFIQTFQANDLSVQLGSFETTPTGQGGAFWQGGRGPAVDSSGNVYVTIDSAAYNPPISYADSVLKFSPGTVSPIDWFTPANWNFLYERDLDQTSNGVTLIPGTALAFTGGKVGVIYLLDQNNLGGLESGSGNAPLQEFQATQGCGDSNCGQHLPTAFWPHATNPYLYVWDVQDYLRAYPFDPGSQRFLTGSATVGTFLPSRAGGMTISSNGSTDGTGIVWATTAAQNPLYTAVPGTLRAYNANNITQELYDSDQNSCRDGMGKFVKMSTPIVANGRVYVNTQSNMLPVYGLLPTSGTVHVTVGTSVSGLAVSVDGGASCMGPQGFDWVIGSTHTISTPAAQAGIAGTQFLWQSWSDGLPISHTVTATPAITSYIANFKIQYLLTTQVSPESPGVGSISPSTGFFDALSSVGVTAAATLGFTTFTGFSGALLGTTNPGTVIMSGPLTVTANFQALSGMAEYVTGTTLSQSLRQNFSGWVGMGITVGATPVTVTALGRIFVAGNTGSHTVKIVNASNGRDVSGGSVTVSMSGGTPGSFVYASLPASVTLNANSAYYILSQETQGGDQWYDYNATTIQTTSVAAETSAIWSSDSVTFYAAGSADESYVPVDFLYSFGVVQPGITLQPQSQTVTSGMTATFSAAATGGDLSYVWQSKAPGAGSFTPISGATGGVYTTPATSLADSGTQFMCTVTNTSGSISSNTVTLTVVASLPGTKYVTSVTQGTARDNYSGWVGMVITTGGSPVTVNAVGRTVVPGNTSSHTVKLVNVSTGEDVPGGSASVATSSGPPGGFAYTALANPVTLNPNSRYYLMSSETFGGDQWYDYNSSVQTTGVAVETSAVYGTAPPYVTTGTKGESYVPVDFMYGGTTGGLPGITLQPQNATVAVGQTAGFSVSASSGTTLTYQWQSQASGTAGFVNIPGATNTTYMTPATQTSDNGTQFQCVVTNGSGSVTSNVVTLTVQIPSPPGISVQPQSQTVVVGSMATFSVTATGSNLTYMWESEAPGAASFTAIAGATASSYTTPVTTLSDSGTQFMCVVTNLQSSTPSNAATLTVNASVPGTKYVTSVTPGTLRDSFSGWVGMSITVGATPVTVTALGRIFVAGNTGSHTVKIVNASNGQDISGGSVTVSMSGGTPGSFVYASLPASVTLNAYTTYYIVSQETASGDLWYDINSTIQTTVAATETAGVWSPNGATYYLAGAADQSYGPVDFQYVGAAAASFISKVTPGTLRSNFTGWVGAVITTGSSAIQVTQLGRYFTSGNNGTHNVKLVNASTGTDVSGGSVSVSMTAGAAGGFVYATLASPVTLSPNTAYFIVSEEMQGGDQWYDHNTTVQTSKVAADTASVWSPDGATYNELGYAGQMYVPVSFVYSLP